MEAKKLLNDIRLLGEGIQMAKVAYRVQEVRGREMLERQQDRLDALQQMRDDRLRTVVHGLLKLRDPELALILCLRYVEGKDWESIEETMVFSRSQIFRLHRKALGELTEVLSQDQGLRRRLGLLGERGQEIQGGGSSGVGAEQA